MKNFFAAIIILIGFSCKKEQQKETETKAPETLTKCGILLATPILDSFVYPTYYITVNVAFLMEMKQCIFMIMLPAITTVPGFSRDIAKTVLSVLTPDLVLPLPLATFKIQEGTVTHP